MRPMNMPGFTAEASLPRTGEPYRMTGDAEYLTRAGEISPALPIRIVCSPAKCFACHDVGGVTLYHTIPS